MENKNFRSEKSKKWLLIFISFFLGSLSTHLFYKYIYLSPVGSFFRIIGSNDKDSTNSRQQVSIDPFENLQKQMQKMQEQMLEDNLSGSHFSINLGQQVTTEEDEKFYYYIINPDGMEVKDFKSDITQGVLTLSAQFSKAEQGMTRSFQMHQSFPIPENADAVKMDIQNQNDKIVIKIPKK